MNALIQGISASLTAHLNQGGEVDPTTDWQVVWEASESGQSDVTSQSGNTIRNMVEFPVLKHTNRNKVRVTFAAASTGEPFGIDTGGQSASIGNKDMTEPGGGITSELDQVKLSFSGLSYFETPVGTEIVSDEAEFQFKPGCDMGLIFRFGGTTNDSARVIAGDNIYHDARNGVYYGTDDNTFHAYNGYGIGVIRVEAAWSPNWKGTEPSVITTSDSFWADKTCRFRIDGTVILQSGTKIKIKGRSPDTDAITAMYVGIGASSGDAYDFASTPVQVTFNGGNSASGAPDGSGYVESDYVDLDINEGDDIVVAFKVGVSKSVYRGSPSYQPTGWDCWYKASVDDTTTVNATGYTVENACPFLIGFTIFNDDYGSGDGASGDEGDPPPNEPEEDSSGPPTASGDWEHLLQSQPIGRQSAVSGFANRVTRMVVRKGAILNTGTALKVVYYGGAGGYQIDSAYLHYGTATAGEKFWNFINANAKKITFGGSSTAFVAAGTFLESDPISLDVDGTRALVFSLFSATSDQPYWSTGFGGFAADGACFGVHRGALGNFCNEYPNGFYGVSEAGAVIYVVRDVMVIDAQATTPYNSTVNDTFWAGKDVRGRIDSSVLTRTGSQVSIKFRTPDTDAISNCFVGIAAAAGDSYDFASTPTRVTFDGGNNASGAPNSLDNNTKYSDFVDLNVGTGDSILVAMQIASGKNVKRGSPGNQLTGWDFWYKVGGDPSVVDASGYTSEGATPCLIGLNII